MKTSTTKKLINSIDEYLKKYSHTRTWLAEKMGISKQQLSDQLSGRIDFRASLIDKFAEALDVTPAYLLASDEERALWERGLKNRPSLKEEIKALVDSLDDELKLKVLRASAQGIVDHGTDRDMLPKKLKKSS